MKNEPGWGEGKNSNYKNRSCPFDIEVLNEERNIFGGKGLAIHQYPIEGIENKKIHWGCTE